MARRKPKLTGIEATRPPSAVDQFTSTARTDHWPAYDVSDGTIDLRAEMADLLDKHGHYAFLRRSTGRRCACWNTATLEADPNCSHCTGEGWAYEDVKVLCRKTFLTDPMTAAFLNKLTPLGRVSVSDQIFWMKYDKKPTRLDKIVEVSLDDDMEPEKPYRIEIIWEINWSQDYRDKWGRVEFWACWCHNTGMTK